MSEIEYVEVYFDEIIMDTGAGGAKLISVDGDEHWIPNSLSTEGDDDNILEIERWFAEKEELV